jgi:hypothetical protein
MTALVAVVWLSDVMFGIQYARQNVINIQDERKAEQEAEKEYRRQQRQEAKQAKLELEKLKLQESKKEVTTKTNNKSKTGAQTKESVKTIEWATATQKQKEQVLGWVLDGMTRAELARRLGTSPTTARRWATQYLPEEFPEKFKTKKKKKPATATKKQTASKTEIEEIESLWRN